MKIKAESVKNSKGQPIAGHIVIEVDNCKYYQAYGRLIAKIEYRNSCRVVILDRQYWNYSLTTNKYRAQFLQETTEETRTKIENGTYQLEDLNK